MLPAGFTGHIGVTGFTGPIGVTGFTGPIGVTGPAAVLLQIQSSTGPTGQSVDVAGGERLLFSSPDITFNVTSISGGASIEAFVSSGAGSTGPTGVAGSTGPTGVAGFADFYALMPLDNAATVAPGTDVAFPQDGPLVGTDISRGSSTTFLFNTVGVYLVNFQVSVTEPGQLVATLNGVELPRTVSGRETGTSQIVGVFGINATSIGDILTIRNPAGNVSALTITPIAGGAAAVSAHVVITKIS